jgi:hypothetical protein
MDDDRIGPPIIARLRLLSDQPVEGCELTPDIFLSNGVPVHSTRLEYRWYRSITKMACSWCGKTPVIMQRLTDDAYFCSVPCFTHAWAGHTAQHRTGLTTAGARSDTAKQAEGWIGRDVQETTEQKWVEVADTSTYIPSVDDVGHMLKLVRGRPRLTLPPSPLGCARRLRAPTRAPRRRRNSRR